MSRYRVTIFRDDEVQARSIYRYDNVIDAVNCYNRYTDWGFAKNYLRVVLSGEKEQYGEKILRRPSGGECTFIREDYVKAQKILLSYKDKMKYEDYQSLIKNFAELFSRDNIRFDVSRFFRECQCEEVSE
jgi:hypothetical protein